MVTVTMLSMTVRFTRFRSWMIVMMSCDRIGAFRFTCAMCIARWWFLIWTMMMWHRVQRVVTIIVMWITALVTFCWHSLVVFVIVWRAALFRHFLIRFALFNWGRWCSFFVMILIWRTCWFFTSSALLVYQVARLILIFRTVIIRRVSRCWLNLAIVWTVMQMR